MPDYLEMLRGLLGALGPREAEAKMFPMDDRASAMVKAQREAQLPAPGTPRAENPLAGAWFSPERRAVYQAIGRAAEVHPQTVEVAAPREWPREHQPYGGFYNPRSDRIDIAPTDYDYLPPITSGGKRVMEGQAFNFPAGTSSKVGLPLSDPATMPNQDVLAHEQLHFLMYKLMQAEAAEREARRSGMSWPQLIRERYQKGPERPTGAEQAFSPDARQHQVMDYLIGSSTTHPFMKQDTVPEPMTGPQTLYVDPAIADAYRRLIYQIFPEGARRERALTGLGAGRGGTLLEELR